MLATHLPYPMLANQAKATREQRPLNYTTFGVDVNLQDSSIGLGRDGKTYVKIPLPRQRSGKQKGKLNFQPRLISHATKWAQYNEKSAPELYEFFAKNGGPIADFYMILFEPGNRAFCIVVEP